MDKQVWCFVCNSLRSICIHDNCNIHCSLCFKI